ncbi:MAG: DUF4340 domain-containing protein [Gemmatimonadetes bacterium]|nr:DUF4340 domain-containing protein [Gemmatimonadota bacterium]MYB58771.1 DUF4340 domain-containing protein [Gemmatimonadota bacterium]MYD61234.1 DUF4340 domain-containing protein [Gemmatimonadota bacterium]
MNNLKWLLIGIAVLLGLYALLQVRESGYTTPTGQVFPENTDDIYRIEMMAKGDSLTLHKKDLEWTIVGHDTLKIRDLRITALFEQVLKVSRETTMTDKSDNWSKYAVDDAMGTHVVIYNAKDELLAHAVFGRSSTDWARNYVRIGDGPEVYLTDRSIVYQVSTDATFWGEKLPEPAPAVVDSSDVAPAPTVVDSAKAGDEG